MYGCFVRLTIVLQNDYIAKMVLIKILCKYLSKKISTKLVFNI